MKKGQHSLHSILPQHDQVAPANLHTELADGRLTTLRR